MIKYFVTLLLLQIWAGGFAQSAVILLENPSFEDNPMPGRPPKNWYFCGPAGETPPDVHPIGIFGEVPQPLDGSSYVGMVARDNDTWESIGQQLKTPMLAGGCYSFLLYAARSAEYRSVSRITGSPVNYDTPLILRIYGATQNCDGRTLLSESPPIVDHQWKPYNFVLQPEADFDHLILEAYYVPGFELAYNGNILIDRCSAIIPIDCATQEPAVAIERLRIPSVGSIDSLRTFIAEHGKLIKFKPEDAELESHFFLDERQIDQQINKYLWLIAKALRRFPQQKLDVRLGGEHAKEKIINFHRALLLLKVPEKQYRLKLFKKRDLKKNWLWRSENQEIFINLNPI